MILISALAVLCVNAIIAVYFSRSKKNDHELVLYGNVDVRQVDVGFRVPGKVAKMLYEEGDEVREGALIAALEVTPYDSQLNQAVANLESIKANFINAEILLKRRQELIHIGGVSQEDLDNALATRNRLFADLNQAEASVAVALDNLSYTKAFAPADGVILTRVREPGTVVKESDSVYTISIATPVWIRAFVDEPNLGYIYYGMPAEIFTDTTGEPSYTGTVGFISPVAEFTPKTVETTQLRTDLVYRLRIYVDNPDRMLKQGMPVTVKLKKQRDPRE
jgi:HlyD family secretion protein